jgi:hypothetical protein
VFPQLHGVAVQFVDSELEFAKHPSNHVGYSTSRRGLAAHDQGGSQPSFHPTAHRVTDSVLKSGSMNTTGPLPASKRRPEPLLYVTQAT